MRRGLVLLVFALLAPPAAAAPKRLSRQAPPKLQPSTYGSGVFGSWELDRFGMPDYRYEIDQTTDPRAVNTEPKTNKTQAFHQLGNDNIVAFAINDGFTTLWSQARVSQFVNRWAPERNKWGGGFGYLNVGGKVASTLYLDRVKDAKFERRFGIGYATKDLAHEGIAIHETTYAPYGDDPLLLHDVRLTNTTPSAKQASWFEYWDVNPEVQPAKIARAVGAPQWDPATKTLSVDQLPDNLDQKPMTIFASALRAPVSGFDTSLPAFFGSAPSRAQPAAALADATTDSIAAPGSSAQTMFAFRSPVTLQPGQSVTLRYAYGIAHREQIPELVKRNRAAKHPFATSSRKWRRFVPRADFGAGEEYVARELQWGAYLLRSAAVYEEECGAHTITQGGYYQYGIGQNLGYRSWLHYLLPMVYTDPAMAREILRYSIRLQPPDGFVPYGTQSLCLRMDLGTSNDLDFWLLLAAGEYGLGMRDPQFFDEKMNFYGSHEQATAWEHIKLAYRHQESFRSNHGYTMGATGDWSDFATPLGPMTTSMLVVTQLAYAYPKLAELAELRHDFAFARTLRARAKELRQEINENWTGKGWIARGYLGEKQQGAGAPYGEPQPWALLSGALTPERATILVANIRRFLTGIGAPGGPSKIGSAMSPARDDPDITETGPSVGPNVGVPDLLGPAVKEIATGLPLSGAAVYPGGVWFDINGHLTWALGELDGIVPGARELAWDEYKRNLLATHATAFPEHWNGVLNIDDACAAWYGSAPADCGIGIALTLEGLITEQPTWVTMDALRLAGITPIRDGYHVDPHLPLHRFTVRTQRIGVAVRKNLVRGFVRPERSGRVLFEVVLPHPRVSHRAVVHVNGRRVKRRVRAGTVRFHARLTRRRATDWSVDARVR